MDHLDHINLLDGITGAREQAKLQLRGKVETWADFGSGEGAFSLALADLLSPGSTIFAIDKQKAALDSLIKATGKVHPDISFFPILADFTIPLQLPKLNGAVCANSLHFLNNRNKLLFLKKLREYLCPGGQLIIIEYNTDLGNQWVPYPMSYSTCVELITTLGYTKSTWLNSRPSRFLKEIYSLITISE